MKSIGPNPSKLLLLTSWKYSFRISGRAPLSSHVWTVMNLCYSYLKLGMDIHRTLVKTEKLAEASSRTTTNSYVVLFERFPIWNHRKRCEISFDNKWPRWVFKLMSTFVTSSADNNFLNPAGQSRGELDESVWIPFEDSIDEKAAPALIAELSRLNIPLVTVNIKDESCNFATLDYGHEFVISRSRSFISSTEAMQEISDKLCAPIAPPVAQRLIPEEKCEIEMKADVLLVLDGSFSTQVGFHFRSVSKTRNTFCTILVEIMKTQ